MTKYQADTMDLPRVTAVYKDGKCVGVRFHKQVTRLGDFVQGGKVTKILAHGRKLLLEAVNGERILADVKEVCSEL